MEHIVQRTIARRSANLRAPSGESTVDEDMRVLTDATASR
jgi:hypothetical protein